MMNMPIAVSCIMCGMNNKENSAPFAFNSYSAEFDGLGNTLKDISIYLLGLMFLDMADILEVKTYIQLAFILVGQYINIFNIIKYKDHFQRK